MGNYCLIYSSQRPLVFLFIWYVFTVKIYEDFSKVIFDILEDLCAEIENSSKFKNSVFSDNNAKKLLIFFGN